MSIWRREKRSNETHRSTADNDAQLFGKAAVRRASSVSWVTVLMDNRNGLAVDAELTVSRG